MALKESRMAADSGAAENPRAQFLKFRGFTSLMNRVRPRLLQVEDVKNNAEAMSALNRIATHLSGCVTTSEVLTEGLRLATETTGFSRGAILLAEGDGKSRLAAHAGMSHELISFLTAAPEYARKLAYQATGGRSLVLDTADFRKMSWPTISHEKPPDSALLVPLISRGQTLGALALLAKSGHICTEHDLSLAQAVAAQIGIAFESTHRYEQLKDLADRDSVTGLLNHRSFYHHLERAAANARQHGGQFSIILMDVDDFKLFNDTYGHQTGDKVLCTIANTLVQSSRGTDMLARYGGDELVALAPNTDTDGAVALAERFRQALQQHPFLNHDQTEVPIRLSYGVATFPVHAEEIHQLVAFADANMYESKELGGDIITVESYLKTRGRSRAGDFSVLDGLVTAVDNKDHYTRRHSEDVVDYALAMARALELSEDHIRTLRIASLLHDVGKIGVPDWILRKPAKLNDEEIAIVKQHPLLGEMIIKELPNVEDVLAAVGNHHERMDGAGYPRGLRGENIPLLGRIMAVADAYSAMTTDRPYRKAMSQAEAKTELLRASGSQLDPTLVRLFIEELDTGSVHVRDRLEPGDGREDQIYATGAA